MKKFYAIALFVFGFGFAKAQLTLHCDSILQTSTCAGGNVIVPFTVSGGNYSFGNVFTAQLSDMWGSFANPVNIGSVTWFTSGLIFATIPANTNFGFLYRVRIISSNPADTSNNSPNTLVITQVAQLNTIIATPNDTACNGDTVTLYAVNPASSYSWSTGDTTQSIQVTQSGIYTVTTTDFLTCQSSTEDTIIFMPCTGITENSGATTFEIFPNPAQDQLTIRSGKPFEHTTLTLYNALGQMQRSHKLQAVTEQRIDVHELPPGMYFVVIEAEGLRLTRRLLLQ